MPSEILAAFIAFAIVMSGTPGPNVLLVMASGVNHGFRATIPHMLGVTVGFSIMLLAIGVGLSQLFVTIPHLYLVLKVASVIYLLWLAWKVATAMPAADRDASTASRPMTFFQGAAFQWVNPKAWTICLSVVAAYTVPSHFMASLLTAAALFIAINWTCLMIWAGFGVGLRRLLQDPTRVRIFNVAMAALLVASLWPLVQELLHDAGLA